MDKPDHSDHSADVPQLFVFEQPSCENFTYITLSVRFHLDRGGWRLSLAQWQALPHADRVALAAQPVPESIDGDAGVGAAFDARLADLAARHLREPIERVPPLSPMPGDAQPAVPADVQQQMTFAALGPLSAPQWNALSRFQRYALAKLSRKPKPNHDFLPAIREFGLA